MDTTLEDPLVGREVDGRYLIESRIAHGGMANVYLALDRRLDREVAFKVLYEHLSTDEEFVARFVREARAAARLTHPNAVQVFDQGWDGPVLYLAMEYLPGRTLRDVLMQRGALTPRESISVMEPVLGALGAAHRAGIVHRDIKPENVILTDDGRIKVADFGLARAVTAPMTSSNGQLIGTVAYLAPELVSRGVADARADVYAAGILLFELLTGKQPFVGDDPLQVAYRHVHETVPPPSQVSAGVTPDFDELVLRATSHNPDERPADADDFLAQLRAVNAQMSDEVLDVRAAEAEDLRRNAATTVDGAPAAAIAPQATRALEVEGRGRRAMTSAREAAGGLAQLVPRLRVNDDDDVDAGDGMFASPRNRALALGGLLAGVLAVLLIAVWYFASGPGSKQTVPPLTAKLVAEAQKDLQAAGLTAKVQEEFSDKVPPKTVIRTDPAGGESIKKGGVVTLFVSKGPNLVAVPDLAGKTVEEATALLGQQGLEVGDTSEKHSGKVDKGRIISIGPVKGTQVKPGSKVDLVVSSGPEPVQLDNVVNQNVDQAKKTLEDKGFKVVVNEIDAAQAPGVQPGTVTAMDPVWSGQELPKGSTVTLTAVKQPPSVGIPDVRGQNFGQAYQTLTALGFQVQRNGFFGNTVTDQNPLGQAPYGSTITLTVSPGR